MWWYTARRKQFWFKNSWLASKNFAKHDIDLRRDRQALQRLTEAAEKAKCELSGLQKTKISLPLSHK